MAEGWVDDRGLNGKAPATGHPGLPPATRSEIMTLKGRPETGVYASDINAPQPIIRFPFSL